jgi:hypothetical protein
LAPAGVSTAVDFIDAAPACHAGGRGFEFAAAQNHRPLAPTRRETVIPAVNGPTLPHPPLDVRLAVRKSLPAAMKLAPHHPDPPPRPHRGFRLGLRTQTRRLPGTGRCDKRSDVVERSPRPSQPCTRPFWIEGGTAQRSPENERSPGHSRPGPSLSETGGPRRNAKRPGLISLGRLGGGSNWRRSAAKLAKHFEGLMNKTHDVGEQRNRIIHDAWYLYTPTISAEGKSPPEAATRQKS